MAIQTFPTHNTVCTTLLSWTCVHFTCSYKRTTPPPSVTQDACIPKQLLWGCCQKRFRQNPVSEWILIMRSNEGISLIKIHSLTGFCFYPVMFSFQYISSRIVNFYLKYYELFFYSKSRRSPITAIETFHITTPWRHSKHPLLWENG